MTTNAPPVRKRFTSFYPLWIVSSPLLGLLRPEALNWFTVPWVVWALSLVTLGMGFPLRFDDFRRLRQSPGAIGVGVALQYTVMPLPGWLVAKFCGLHPELAVGLILVASCPDGTASNLITYAATLRTAGVR